MITNNKFKKKTKQKKNNSKWIRKLPKKKRTKTNKNLQKKSEKTLQ